jgi:hypothetical protein
LFSSSCCVRNEPHAPAASLAAQGLTLEQVRAKVDPSADAKRCGQRPVAHTWFKALFADPIVAGACWKAKGEPIAQNLNG